ncbi:MAG: hypothetical protein OXC54_10200 [Rhodospirillaceae bacterium]|nr:hypothetical protein [Rhodospirillaceae bacterium]
MALVVRIYPTEESAVGIDANLTAAGFGRRLLLRESECRERPTDALQAGIRAGMVPKRMVKTLARYLEQGHSIIAAEPPFGRAQRVIDIMESVDTVDSHIVSRYAEDNPAPLSDVLGLSTLSDFSSSTELLDSRWNLSSKFGFALLSGKATPLSSMFRMTVLSAAKRNWRSSFGLPLKSRNAAPLSSLLGMAPLSSRQRCGNSKFGFPLLSRNPTPLSNLLGIKVLSRGRK